MRAAARRVLLEHTTRERPGLPAAAGVPYRVIPGAARLPLPPTRIHWSARLGLVNPRRPTEAGDWSALVRGGGARRQATNKGTCFDSLGFGVYTS